MMNNDGTKDFLDKLAKIISALFHPLFIPVYGMAIILSAPTLFEYLPFAVKKLLLIIILINNVFLPISLLPFFIHSNIISSWTINSRRERIIPLMITAILYSASSFIIFRFPIPFFLKSFILAATFLALMATVINFWWKVSLHSVGSGAIIGMVLILSFKMNTPLMWYLISVIIAGGLILSSRLRLNFHSPQQVWFGFLTGFLGLTLFMMFF